MAERYSDFIKIQRYLPVYDMTDEKHCAWDSFIPTKQFCSLLQRSMTAITSQDANKRRSMWVNGTFGTGKSHASSVVCHLLCDPLAEVAGYIQNLPDDALRGQLLALRESQRYFPVIIKGVEGAYNIPRFALSIQRQTKLALAAAGHKEIIVTSDFDKAIRWVESHRARVPELLEISDDLASEVSNADKLIAKLQSHDIDVYLHLEAVLAVDDTYLSTTSISEWLAEVSETIVREGIASGLIIFWDEFTSVVDTLKSDRINLLQNIAEKSQQSHVFLYLISHRMDEKAFDTRLEEDIRKMRDRFDSVGYAMDEISTYLILRHTFSIQDEQRMRIATFDMRRAVDKQLYDYLCESSSAEEKEHIQSLFPMHPYTAFLCSKMSGIMGSANRSVLRFMNDEACGFKHFIDDPTNYDQRMMLTAEWLWDFFYPEMQSNTLYMNFTAVYAANKLKAERMSDDYVRVFKVVLLLNALSARFKSAPEKYAPNEQNIQRIFSGDRCQQKLKEILDWLDESRIIARDIFGEFKISVSNYDPSEIQKQKSQVTLTYKTAVDYLNYSQESKEELAQLLLVGDRLMRKCEPQFYACEESEAVVRSKLNKYTREKPNHLHVALFFAITDEARDMVQHRVQAFSDEFKDTLFIVPSEVFTPAAQTQFIDAVAQANVSRSYMNTDDASQLEATAKEYVVKWKNRMNGSDYALYFRGQRYGEGILSNIYTVVNRRFSAQVFPQGMESVRALQGETMTFFKNKNFQTLALQILQKRTRDEMTAFKGDTFPAKKLFDGLLTDTCELKPEAQTGDSWIATICREVDALIEAAKKKYVDRFSLSDILAPLMRPPYGMFKNAPCYAALSFALRKHKDDLFNPSTSQPVGDEKLRDMIVDLMAMWDGGVSESSNKLLLRFGSAEERDLTNLLGEVFNLSSVPGVSMADLKSLNYAKWSIGEYCKQVAKFPLWSLLHCSQIDGQPACRKIVEELIALFNAESYALPKVKELFKEMRPEQIPLYRLLTNVDNYREGFMTFLHNIADVEIEDDWWEELEDELSHLQSEVAFRKEVDVEKCVYQFSVRKLKEKEKPSTPSGENQPETVSEPTGAYTPAVPPATKPSDDEIRTARNLVRSQTMPGTLWQKVVLDMLEEHPEVSKFLVKYLGN